MVNPDLPGPVSQLDRLCILEAMRVRYTLSATDSSRAPVTWLHSHVGAPGDGKPLLISAGAASLRPSYDVERTNVA